MTATGRTSGTRWRAIWALCLLLSSALGPAVRLMLPEPVTCGMACCLSSGDCCCLGGWTAEADDAHGHQETTIASQPEALAGCPPNCATAPSVSPGLVLKSGGVIAYDVRLKLLNIRPHEWRIAIAADQDVSPSSPRGPPSLLL